MNLALLEDLIAIEDVADLREAGPLLGWLDANGLLDVSRLATCGECRMPFVRRRLANNQRYCSPRCCKSAWRRGPNSDRRAA